MLPHVQASSCLAKASEQDKRQKVEGNTGVVPVEEAVNGSTALAGVVADASALRNVVLAAPISVFFD